MEILKAIILGIVQGLTEFLPVSSSGHLEIVKYILGEDAVGDESLILTVVLHFATALSTIVIFRKFIWELLQDIFRKEGKESRFFAGYIVLSMVPAALVGVFFEETMESLFNGNLILVCSMLIVTGILLFVADRANDTNKDIGWLSAFVIGISQAIAIIPGISRSGATISTSVLMGIDREKAARFSFLMVIPLIFGKITKDLLSGDLSSVSSISQSELLFGFIAAFFTGLLACTWMIKLVKSSNLRYFSYYCFLIAAIGLSYSLF